MPPVCDTRVRRGALKRNRKEEEGTAEYKVRFKSILNGELRAANSEEDLESGCS